MQRSRKRDIRRGSGSGGTDYSFSFTKTLYYFTSIKQKIKIIPKKKDQVRKKGDPCSDFSDKF